MKRVLEFVDVTLHQVGLVLDGGFHLPDAEQQQKRARGKETVKVLNNKCVQIQF